MSNKKMKWKLTIESKYFVIILFLINIIISLHNVNGKIFERCELARFLKNNYGLPVENVANWVCIAQHQSGLNSSLYTGTINIGSHGIFQVSDEFWCSPPGKGWICQISCDKLRDNNLADDYSCIKLIYDEHEKISGDGFNAWPTYQQYCKGNAHQYVSDCFNDNNYGYKQKYQQQQSVAVTTQGYYQQRSGVQKSGKIYERCELARELYYKHKMPMNQIDDWVCIAYHESNFNTAAIGRLNIDGSEDHGIFQISDIYWCSKTGLNGKACGVSCDKFEDENLIDDVDCIKRIYNEHTKISGNGFTAWTAWTAYCQNRSFNYMQDCFDSNVIQASTPPNRLYTNTQHTLLNVKPIQRVTKQKGKIYKPCELAKELRERHQIPESQIATWVCIAKHESNFNTSAIGYGDHGLFQISDIYWCSPPGHGWACGIPCSDLEDSDITDDLACMMKIFEEHTRLSGNGFNAWTVYPLYCSNGRAEEYIENCESNRKITTYQTPVNTFKSNGNIFFDKYFQTTRSSYLEKTTVSRSIDSNDYSNTKNDNPFLNKFYKASKQASQEKLSISPDNPFLKKHLQSSSSPNSIEQIQSKEHYLSGNIFLDKFLNTPKTSFDEKSAKPTNSFHNNPFLNKHIKQPIDSRTNTFQESSLFINKPPDDTSGISHDNPFLNKYFLKPMKNIDFQNNLNRNNQQPSNTNINYLQDNPFLSKQTSKPTKNIDISQNNPFLNKLTPKPTIHFEVSQDNQFIKPSLQTSPHNLPKQSQKSTNKFGSTENSSLSNRIVPRPTNTNHESIDNRFLKQPSKKQFEVSFDNPFLSQKTTKIIDVSKNNQFLIKHYQQSTSQIDTTHNSAFVNTNTQKPVIHKLTQNSKASQSNLFTQPTKIINPFLNKHSQPTTKKTNIVNNIPFFNNHLTSTQKPKSPSTNKNLNKSVTTIIKTTVPTRPTTSTRIPFKNTATTIKKVTFSTTTKNPITTKTTSRRLANTSTYPTTKSTKPTTLKSNVYKPMATANNNTPFSTRKVTTQKYFTEKTISSTKRIVTSTSKFPNTFKTATQKPYITRPTFSTTTTRSATISTNRIPTTKLPTIRTTAQRPPTTTNTPKTTTKKSTPIRSTVERTKTMTTTIPPTRYVPHWKTKSSSSSSLVNSRNDFHHTEKTLKTDSRKDKREEEETSRANVFDFYFKLYGITGIPTTKKRSFFE